MTCFCASSYRFANHFRSQSDFLAVQSSAVRVIQLGMISFLLLAVASESVRAQFANVDGVEMVFIVRSLLKGSGPQW